MAYKEHNLREVYPNLFVSDVTVHKNITMLKSLGISAVLNLVSVEEDSDVSNAYCREGLDFMHLPMYDMESYKLDSVVEKGTDYIERCLRADRKILVHCVAGMSRSPAIVIAYFITKLGMTFYEARRCVGTGCAINEGFVNQLSRLERKRSFHSSFLFCCCDNAL